MRGVKDDDTNGRRGADEIGRGGERGGERGRKSGPVSFGSVADLLRETADGMGQLVIQHVKLAQLELTAELRAMGSRAALIAIYVVLMVVGYMLTMTGVALLVGAQTRLGWCFLGLGLLHVVGTAFGMLLAFRNRPHPRLMQNSTDELNQSATALIAAGRAPTGGAAVAGTALEPVNGR
ncbi:MAG: phage holin family protein [Myxococcales bacterium]